MTDLLVIGGGAAGLMAAGAACARGLTVTVLEHNPKGPGQKLLITGKGRCNVTSDSDVREFLPYVRHNGRFLYSSLYAFPPAAAMELFESLGVPLKTERGRRVFPQSDRAADVLAALRDYAHDAEFVRGSAKKLIIEDGVCKGAVTDRGETLRANSTLLATGGISYPATGSDGSGYKLLAIEGFINRFVAEDPWFAGWCGVMVNLSDIAAMGGRPLAVVNALWDEAQPHAAQILQGMAAASRAYQVPIVGGHTNLRSDRSQLAVAVLGETASPLSSSAAQAGQTLMVAINLQGRWHPPGNNWDAATRADPAELRRALALLPELAAEGSLCAAKDISQAGLAGTLTMMLESCGLGAEVTLEQIPIPAEIDLEQWLCAFPSFGFLLAVDEARCHEVAQRFAACGIACAVAGHFTREQKLILRYREQRACYWDLTQQPFTGITHQ